MDTYKHLKTNGNYWLLHDDAKLEWDLSQVVIYKSQKDGSIWIRPKSEFFDGRFVKVLPTKGHPL